MNLSASTHFLGNLVANHRKLWIKLGNAETALLKPDLQDITIQKPVYVCGFARSGSTIILETLASLPDIASHRYQDFPFLFTPCWWNFLLSITGKKDTHKQERAHGDGILVNSESPEAMEEMLWMAFFSQLHSEKTSEILNENIEQKAFEAFYPSHIKKLLLVRKASRYLSKGNYNLTRMGYIQRIFPDARFIIPIRDPITHVESLVRQHKRFMEAGNADARATRHMDITGHFEFGQNRKAVHTGDDAQFQEIVASWENGNDVRGFALQWNMLYRFIYQQMIANKTLGKACLVIPFENLCDTPQDTLTHMLAHCDLQADEHWLASKAAAIRAPSYYTSSLTEADKKMIHDICGETAALFGY